MPIYKDTPQNRKLKRVGMGYGTECSPCEVKKKEDKKVKIKKKPNIDDEIDSLMKTSDKLEKKKKDKKDKINIKPCNLKNEGSRATQMKMDRIKGLTETFSSSTPDGKYLYVILPSAPKELLLLHKKYEKEFGTGHASLAKNGSVLMAGEVMKKGNKLNIDSSSGHYLPDAHCLKYLQKLLEVKYGYKYKSTKERQLKRFMKTTLFFEK